jgi:type I restriction enzyme S subunit
MPEFHDLPPTWRLERARWLLRRVRRPASPQDEVVTAFRDGQVTLRLNRRTEGFTNAIQEIGYQGVRAGDLVVHSMDGFAGAIGVSDSDGKASPVVHVYRGAHDVDLRFIAYALRHLANSGYVTALAKGIRERSTAFDPATLADISLPVPPVEEQRRIADFLDQESTRIGRLLEMRDRQIRLLDERLDSWLVDAITAADGRTFPLKFVARYREGPGIMADEFRDEGTPVLRLGNVKNGTIQMDGCNFVDPDEARRRWAHLAVRPGELLVSGSASGGIAVVVPPEAGGAIPYTGLIRLWPIGDLSRGFLRAFLASSLFAEQVDQLKTGIGIQHWGPAHLARVHLPVPDLATQEQIAAGYERMLEERRTHLDLLQRQRELVIERRRAIIGAAVTGRFDVRTGQSAA